VAGAAWRLIEDAPASGAWNMCVDEALLLHARDAGPTLRLYTWERPTATLGYRQKSPDWLERAHALGVDVVRRVTGGGTVLHDADLTYAVVAPRGWPGLPSDLAGSYAWIQRVLLRALAGLGLPAAPSAGSRQGARSSLCFAAATGTEIDLAGVKLVGSAQRRTPHAFLQHGSIRLRPEQAPRRAQRAEGERSQDALYRRLFGSALAELPEALGGVSRERLADALRAAFSDVLDGALQAAPCSPAEVRSAQARLAERRRDPLAAPGLSLTRGPASADRLP
jgi:lipoate-protein ligase A